MYNYAGFYECSNEDSQGSTCSSNSDCTCLGKGLNLEYHRFVFNEENKTIAWSDLDLSSTDCSCFDNLEYLIEYTDCEISKITPFQPTENSIKIRSQWLSDEKSYLRVIARIPYYQYQWKTVFLRILPSGM